MATVQQEAVFQILRQIPAGKVTTYGQVATMAGLGRAARFVGTTLKNLPKDTQLPWHRVLNSQGRISLPEPGCQVQRERLLLEGVIVISNKVNLKQFLWQV